MNNKNVVILFYPLIERKEIVHNLPYSLLYLERAIRDLDVEIILIDERLNPNYKEIIVENKERLLLVGVSCMIGYQLISSLKFTSIVKKYTQSKIIWGGWFPTVFTELVFKKQEIDFIAVGQGELVLRNLIIKLLNNEPLLNIEGLLTKQDQIENFSVPKLKPINQFPYINFELAKLNEIIDIKGKVPQGNRGVDYLATIGCPYNCSFCNLTYIFGKRWYHKPIDEILHDIEEIKRISNISHITFSDDNFFVKKSFVKELCNKLIEKKICITWEANAHVKTFLTQFNDEDIQLIKKAGCTKIKIGAESGDQTILDLINKQTTVEQNLKLVKILKKHKIGLRYYVMVAFPIDPEKDISLTLTMLAKAKRSYKQLDLNINIFKPIPKTQIYSLVEEKYNFKYPDNIEELIVFFGNKIVFPWHTRDYMKDFFCFSEVYFKYSTISQFSNYIYINKIVYFFINLFFFLEVQVRILFKYWKKPITAYLYLKLKGYSFKEVNSDKIAIIKSR